MKTLYAACLSRLGLSHADAARLHDARPDTIKSWAAGRRSVPDEVWSELRAYEAQIVDRSEQMREVWEEGGRPPIDISEAAADGPSLIAAADFILSIDAPITIGPTPSTDLARQARHPN